MTDLLRAAKDYLRMLDDWSADVSDSEYLQETRDKAMRKIDEARDKLRAAAVAEDARIEQERLRAAIAAHPLDDYELALRFLHLKG